MNIERFAGYFNGKYSVLDRGVDSVVVRDGALVRHYYPYLGQDRLTDYQRLMQKAREIVSARPFIRKPDSSYTVVLQDVVPMYEPTYDYDAGCWTTEAEYIPGPHLSELCYSSPQHREGLRQLEMEEQVRLMDFRMFLRSQGLIPDITCMIREAGELLRSKLRADGIEVTTLDTKARAYLPAQINLIITDLCPSIDRMMVRR